jgi:Family of unknown function (DUF6221)
VDELIAFLNARLDEVEAAAKAADPGPWEFEGDDPTDDEVFETADCRPVAYTRGRQVANGQHIALHDPGRELRDVAAKRAILALHQGDPSEWGGWRADGTWQRGGMVCLTCGHDDGRLGVAWPCPTVRQLAAADSGHPDYRREWAPLPQYDGYGPPGTDYRQEWAP